MGHFLSGQGNGSNLTPPSYLTCLNVNTLQTLTKKKIVHTLYSLSAYTE